jgi:putative ABC transport system ATP-binding protein
MLQLQNVSKLHRVGDLETAALNQINLHIEQGEYVAITGPSGCGKSTLLSILGLLDAPDSGAMSFQGSSVAGASERDLNKLRRGQVGFIFQNFNLIDELSVEQNIALALEYGDLSASERKERVQAAMTRLGVSHRAGHKPSQLSGGQQQRVAIARAIVTRPPLLLADEPTGNLDSVHGDEVMRILQELNEEGTTLVMVTHSPEHARQAGRVIDLLDGRVVNDNAPLRRVG